MDILDSIGISCQIDGPAVSLASKLLATPLAVLMMLFLLWASRKYRHDLAVDRTRFSWRAYVLGNIPALALLLLAVTAGRYLLKSMGLLG